MATTAIEATDDRGVRRSRLAPTRLWKTSRALIVALLFGPVALVALGSGFGLLPLPFEMHVLSEQMPIIFRLHMVTSAAALLLAPVTIAYRATPRVHRMLGRLLGVFVVAGGLTALPVAIFSHSDIVARAGFFVQGCVWLTLLGAGIAAIRTGNRARHQTLMLAMVAVTTGAVWFRLITGTAIALRLPFEPVYAAAAWIGWIAPLSFVLLYPRGIQRFLQR